MRDLDRESIELTAELSKLEQAFLERARNRKSSGMSIIVPTPVKNLMTRAIPAPDTRWNEGGTTEGAASSSGDRANGTQGVGSGGGPVSKSSGDTPKGVKSNKNTPGGGAEGNDPEGSKLLSEIDSLRTRISQRLSQKSSIARNMASQLQKFQAKMNTDLAFFETTLRSCGDFASANGVLPGADVAIRPNPQNLDEMILGRVIAYHADIGAYDVADVDDSKRYHLPESAVTVLDMLDNPRKLSKGEVVHAVYPDTTAFYTAIVTQAPRRGQTGMEPTVMVQFQGDADADGNTPNHTVLLKHVFRALVHG